LIAGHSEGSLIGLLAASQNDNVSRVISLAGPARRADQILRQQLESQPDFVRNTAYPILDSLVAGVQVEQIAPMFAPLFRESIQPYLISWFAYTPMDVIYKNDISVLVINGDNDIQVPMEEGELLSEAANDAIFVPIAEMNHVLKQVDEDMQRNIATYSNPDLPLHPKLVPAIATFIRGE
jgi:pimeloyl-ACP methyl ester carboxylesterase